MSTSRLMQAQAPSCRVTQFSVARQGCTLRHRLPTRTPSAQASQLSGQDAACSSREQTLDRRSQLASAVSVGLLAFSGIVPAAAHAEETPEMGELANKIVIDFAKNQYYVTGNLTDSLYTEDCLFKDPTTTVKGTKKYTDALKLLFDPKRSKAELISLKVDGQQIFLRWRLEGTLNFGNLAIKPYTGTTTYTVDSDSGKIKEHSETWDISTLDAFLSPFFPNFGAPPAPSADQLRANLIKESFTAAGQPIPAGLKLK